MTEAQQTALLESDEAQAVLAPDEDEPDDAGEESRRQAAYGHFTSGGRLIRIASTLPPVFRPNSVPRS